MSVDSISRIMSCTVMCGAGRRSAGRSTASVAFEWTLSVYSSTILAAGMTIGCPSWTMASGGMGTDAFSLPPDSALLMAACKV